MSEGALPLRAAPATRGAALVVAHRGHWERAPQNSIAAFRAAIAAGADAVELDVRRTGDDRLVVVHDPRIGVRPVARLTHAELRARLPDGQAPSLHEVLAAIGGRIGIDIELKEDGYVAEVMALIAGHLRPDSYVVTSFLDEVLPQVREAVGSARTGLLLATDRRPRRLSERIAASGASFIAPHATLARAGVLAWAAERDLPAWPWTVNDPRGLRTLLADPRVGAVITDRATTAVEIARRLPPRAGR